MASDRFIPHPSLFAKDGEPNFVLGNFFVGVHKFIFKGLQNFLWHHFAFYYFGFALKRTALNNAPCRRVADARNASKFSFARAVQYLSHRILSRLRLLIVFACLRLCVRYGPFRLFLWDLTIVTQLRLNLVS